MPSYQRRERFQIAAPDSLGEFCIGRFRGGLGGRNHLLGFFNAGEAVRYAHSNERRDRWWTSSFRPLLNRSSVENLKTFTSADTRSSPCPDRKATSPASPDLRG